MIVQKNFLSKLREFGLNTYESKLWTALLSRGSSTAGELSDIANVPRSRTYDVLESLERKGFIIRKLGKPIKYIAVEPTEVLDRVKDKVSKETDSRMKMIEELRDSDILEELSLLHSQGIELVDPTELTGSITGRDNLHNHLESRLAKAETTVCMLTTPEALKRKQEFMIPMLKRLKDKNVSVKIATQMTKDNRALIQEYQRYAEVKHTQIRGRFTIINSSEVLFMLLDDKIVHPAYDMAIWANSKFFAATLEGIFNEKWNGMKSV
ncbi:TrmB family transcriptional regulator [Candidatus Woesearchaeota archaeon]|nr:TrmB family transcriptional regulator [Candidatus Woesearchaeota archaeon]